MTISEIKKEIVIKNYFEKECTVDTSIREAFTKGFEFGLKKGSKLNSEIIEQIEQLLWNPVSKSLPPEEMMVEVTICEDNGDTTLKYTDAGWYYKGFWVVNNEVRYDIIAWKSFSKAYEGE